jgi:CBS domain-containing membrane protein
MEHLIRLLARLGLTSLAPVMPWPRPSEALRAGAGAALGLGFAACLLWLASGQTQPFLAFPLLIAPFGASAYLIFAVPNSPLAQPWSAVVGNTVSALAAVAILQIPLPLLIAAALAVGLAVLAMAACRAMHPPGGAVALATVLAADPAQLPGLGYILTPVALGSLGLVLAGIAWNSATGRHYPFRFTSAAVPLPEVNIALPAQLLTATLARLRLDANLGTADLARLIEAAESEALLRHLGPITAMEVMRRDPVSVTPDTKLPELVALFQQHRFKSLPVRQADGSFAGLVAQSALIGHADASLSAADLASPDIASVTPQTPLAELIRLMVEAGHSQLAVLNGASLAGLITRSDLIALLSGHRPI